MTITTRTAKPSNFISALLQRIYTKAHALDSEPQTVDCRRILRALKSRTEMVDRIRLLLARDCWEAPPAERHLHGGPDRYFQRSCPTRMGSRAMLRSLHDTKTLIRIQRGIRIRFHFLLRFPQPWPDKRGPENRRVATAPLGKWGRVGATRKRWPTPLAMNNA